MPPTTTILGKVSITPKDQWLGSSTYEFLDLVTNLGNSYLSKKDNNTSLLTNATDWLLVAEKGDPFLWEDFTPEQIALLKQPATDAAALANEATLAANTQTGLALEATTAANNAAALANEKATYAEEKGDYALEQGDYAKAQGNSANLAAAHAIEQATAAAPAIQLINSLAETSYLEDNASYGIEWNSTIGTATTRVGNPILHQLIPIQKRMKGCLLNDNGDVVEYLSPSSWVNHVRNGSLGQVMVEIPSHYRKIKQDGNIKGCRISEYPLPGYHLVPKMYISAYEATVERTTGKLCSVVNQEVNYRGGNNNASWDGTYRTLIGRAASNLSRTAFRNAARLRKPSSTEWNAYVWRAHVAMSWLYYIEYGSRNCQLVFNAQKDASGYAQGGLGAGVTNMVDWAGHNSTYPFVPIAITDALGNGSGEVAYNVLNEDTSLRVTTMVPRYRGIENPFGHVYKWTDGINIEVLSDSDGGTSKIYVCADPSLFVDNGYTNYSLIGLAPRANGYISEMALGEYGDLIASATGGGSTTFWADYFYTSVTSSSLLGVLSGGTAHYGASAGLGCAYSSRGPALANADIGSRLCFIPG